MLVEHVLSKDFCPDFDTVPCVDCNVFAASHVDVARMHAAIALTKVHYIATAIALLLVACLRLVRLPAMHEERPSNVKIAGEIILRIRILTAGPAVRFPVHVAFTLATVLRSALRTAFCTASALHLKSGLENAQHFEKKGIKKISNRNLRYVSKGSKSAKAISGYCLIV